MRIMSLSWLWIARALALATVCLLPGLSSPAAAHSFNTVFILPEVLAEETKADVLVAFLLATEERDAHANEESDGHLGGLDVYVTPLSLNSGAAILGAAPDILAAPLSDPNELREILKTSRAALVGPLDPESAASAGFLARSEGGELPPFADRFRAQTARQPGPEAILAYLAARRIDRAVRRLGGVDDMAALQELLAE